MEIYLAKPRGFCAGVSNAINIVEYALKKFGAPLYVFHEIVHNTAVVSDLRRRGVLFVEQISEVPEGKYIVISAHGVPPSVMEQARARKVRIIDATCPLVKKVHQEAARFSEKKYQIILIGHRGHQEVIGTSGYIHADLLHIVETEQDIPDLKIRPEQPVAYLTQTTLSVDETRHLVEKIKEKFPRLVGPAKEDICYATQTRQDAVKALARLCDVIIICGSANSSNSNRLRETGERQGVPSYLIDRAEDLDLNILKGKNKIGISSGASVPAYITEQLVSRIQSENSGVKVFSCDNPDEKISFSLPQI
ncbi:MAG: 4-hydroxy-3-methylbut-2-enyl diphosphate reductase [Candidatus Omnitrophota bacterium]